MNLIRPLFLLALTLPATSVLAQADISKVNGAVHAQAGQQYGDLETVNGSITVDGDVIAQDISTVNGSIKLAERAQAGDVETVNGSIRIGRNAVIARNLETVNGSIFVDHGSQVGGNIETVNGGIGLVATQLGGSIETVNGDITVGVGSRVTGDIQIKKPSFNFSLSAPRKPRIIIGPDAVVQGKLHFEREVTLHVHTSATIGPVSGATAQRFSSDTAPQD